MWVTSASGIGISALTPQAQSWYSTSSNRINGFSYDAAGNQLNFGPAGTVTLAYDAANRVKSAAINSVGTDTYQYDGSGRRVMRVTPGGVTYVFVYDAAGQLAAQYSTTGGQTVVFARAVTLSNHTPPTAWENLCLSPFLPERGLVGEAGTHSICRSQRSTDSEPVWLRSQ